MRICGMEFPVILLLREPYYATNLLLGGHWSPVAHRTNDLICKSSYARIQAIKQLPCENSIHDALFSVSNDDLRSGAERPAKCRGVLHFRGLQGRSDCGLANLAWIYGAIAPRPSDTDTASATAHPRHLPTGKAPQTNACGYPPLSRVAAAVAHFVAYQHIVTPSVERVTAVRGV